jgi:hypothetical protein
MPILLMLRALTPARMKKKMRTEAMPELKPRKNILPRLVVEHLSLRPDLVLLTPTYPLP